MQTQSGFCLKDCNERSDSLKYNLHMWNKAFVAFDMGYAMAMSWGLFLIVFILTLINLKLAPLWVRYEGGQS